METTITDREGNLTNREYDARGNLMKITERGSTGQPLNPPVVTEFAYDTGNRVASIRNALGATTAFVYDSKGNLTQITNAEGNSSSFTYDNQGRRKTFTDFNGNMTSFEYDNGCPCGAPHKVIFADGTFQIFEYNALGQVTLEEFHEANGTLVEIRQTTYDESGRVIEEKSGRDGDPDHPATIVRKHYDGHLLDREIIVNPASPNETPATPVAVRQSRITDYEYDSNDRLVRQIDAEGGVVEFRYDANGNRVLLQDPVGNITTWVYDTLNRVSEERDPFYNENLTIDQAIALLDTPSGADLAANRGAAHVRAFGYDAEGNQSETIDRNGRRREFTYDSAGRLLTEMWFNTDDSFERTIGFSYDILGNMLTASDPDSNYLFTYDTLNRLTSVDNNPDGTRDVPRVILTYAYDAQGNVISTTDDDGVTVSSTYDQLNRLQTRKWFDAIIPNGETADVDPVRVDFDYNAAGREAEIRRHSDLTATTLVGKTVRTYDLSGRSDLLTHLNAVDELLAGYNYDYDFSGLLTHEERTYTTGTANQLESDGHFRYEYDGEGNMVKKTAIDVNSQPTGNVTTLEYDHRNRLVRVTEKSPGGVILNESVYGYDIHGRRILQSVNGQSLFTAYNGDNAWTDYGEVNEVKARYLFGNNIDDNLARFRPGEGTAWYLTDLLGTVHQIVNAVGTVIHQVNYSSFGNVLSQTNLANGDRYLFTGRELNMDTGLFAYRSREYDANNGRFISADQLSYKAGDHNLYRYTLNSPVNATDPTGTTTLVEAGLLHLAIGLSVYPLVRVYNNQNPLCGIADAVVYTIPFFFTPAYLILASVLGGNVYLSLLPCNLKPK